MKKNKKRVILVILFLMIFAIYLAITLKGEYLQTLEIGEEYLGVFKQNLKYRISMILVNFVLLYIATYITTRFIKRGLKKFFDEEKKEMPKLPNKSISFIFSVIVSVVSSSLLIKRAMLSINSAWFGITDPIFNMDIGYYIFQKPFIEALLLYFIILMIVYAVYVALYYIIVFNLYFEKGINPATLKKNTFLKHLIANIILAIIGLSAMTLLNVQNVLFDKFLNLSGDMSLYGAGLTDSTIKVFGYAIFSIVILVCTILAIKNFKKSKFKNVMFWLGSIPIYLVVLFLIILGFNLIYVKRDELDREKRFINYNISFTKNAYDINNVDEIEIKNSGTVTTKDVLENKEIINNINLLNEAKVLKSLNQYQASSGYYAYNVAKPELYNINGNEQLIYVSPREIITNEMRTYNNKTYEYTHGFGIIATAANNVDEMGQLKYIKSDFMSDNDNIDIKEPRIYFGMETNEPIIINAKDKEEYDYPINSTTTSTNTYNGVSGLKLNFIDRLILGIKEKNLGIAFSTNITNDSKIITTRNIIKRAKSIMPYLKYDKNPYMIITDEGKLVWVLDAYSTSNNYPYSQQTIIEYNGIKEKINYIRNSVKVLIDPYNGCIKFYITDPTDPIVKAYQNIYKDLFTTDEIPQDISKHIVYSEFLYDIQAKMLERYHNIQPEVLYRQDDVWDTANENTTRTTSATTGTDIRPYYTQVKTVDSSSNTLGLVIPYTIKDKQNIISYLVGTYDEKNNRKLTLYKFKSENAILGTMQLDTLVEQDEIIAKELNSLNTTGTRIEKNIIVVPINNTLLYVEPIYQLMLNEETQVPLLKRVIVASGNKVAIGKDIQEAVDNLLSKQAIDIEVVGENKDEIIRQIISANKNLKQSIANGNWEMIGKDMAKMQNLVDQLEKMIEEENKEEDKYNKDSLKKSKNENLQSINILQ